MEFILSPIVFVLMSLLWLSGPAQASCGLDHCPIVRPPGESSVKTLGLRLKIQSRWSTFHLKGRSGSYGELYLGGEYRGLKRFIFGGNVPIAYLVANQRVSGGLGNGIVYGEWHPAYGSKGTVGLGVQVELPWGTRNGLSDAHWVVLPYLNVHLPFWRLFLMVNVGYSQTFGWERATEETGLHVHDGEDFVYLGVHETGEFVYRLALGMSKLNERFQPMLTLNGQQVVVGTDPRSFAHIGVQLNTRFSDSVSLRWSAEVPALRPARYNGRVNVGLIIDF